MTALFEKLLRNNYRCGRMLNSRALDLAGWVGASIPHSSMI